MPPAAYLVQAVQSRDFPVPLVAGERALLRVFPTAQRTTTVGIPAVRARFYLDDREVHVENIPAAVRAHPCRGIRGRVSRESANAEIPGHIVTAGTRDGDRGRPRRDAGLGAWRGETDPEFGPAAIVEVRAMPTLDLTLVPFLWTANPDSSILRLASGMAADPENHEMLRDTRTLLPVGDPGREGARTRPDGPQ